LIQRLTHDLTGRFGRVFVWRHLYQMPAFHLADPEKLQALSAKSLTFLLPLSHCVKLLSVDDPVSRNPIDVKKPHSGAKQAPGGV
jgi:hypothetical protein